MNVGDHVLFVARYHGAEEGEYPVKIIAIHEDTLGRKRYDVAYTGGWAGSTGYSPGHSDRITGTKGRSRRYNTLGPAWQSALKTQQPEGNWKVDKDFKTRGRTGKEKAVNFGQYARSHGWGGKWSADEDNQTVHLFASRGENECIDIYWHDRGVFIGSTYSLAGEKIKLHNVSAAANVVRNKPDEKRLGKAIRRHRRKVKDVDMELVSGGLIHGLQGLQTSLPFDKESSDDEIKAVLFNKSITWVNRYTGQVNSATVGGKSFKVVRNGRDYIDFVDGFGFHAVYLDSIVSVG